nr:MAG TPA: distal tail protein [Caudoviricetes sp.]DAP28903.1 MAG TPA: distal tail protein [Caudoviricetes sp.]DAU54190.1 MAG TPA: distal tail protein [Bacteriophage sp.]
MDHGTFALTFRAEKPFRSEKQRGSVLFQGVNDEINGDVFNAGSEYSNPIINILVNSTSGTDQLSVQIGKETIKIAKALRADDIVDINTEEKTVVINGKSTDFSGKFPRLQAGLNIMNLKANGVYNLDVSVLFPKNFL